MSDLHQSPLKFQNGIVIKYDNLDDGGGSIQYKDFLDYLSSTGKKYKHCLEWCSGLGAIGYSLLDAGIVETVTFMDIYQPSITNIFRNAHHNKVEQKIQAYSLDAISKLPNHLKFDLVVGNPPHSFAGDWNSPHLQRMIVDNNWDIHREFFSNIGSYLEPNSDIILSETNVMKDQIEIAESYNLKFMKVVPAQELSKFGAPFASLHIYQNQ
jgi:methylase of polypeptide subunit release factors